MTKTIISKNVSCPWCGAEPGEDCILQDGPSFGIYGHTARVEQVEDDMGGVSEGAGRPPESSIERAQGASVTKRRPPRSSRR